MNIVVIPDTQVDPDYSVDYLRTIGNYIATKRPDKIVHLGDFAEMGSLSSFDVGKRTFENRRYTKDLAIIQKAQKVLLSPIWALQQEQRKAKVRKYDPDMFMLLGNHEMRIETAIDKSPVLEGTIALSDLNYTHYGWKVLPFTMPLELEGIAFCHYFSSGEYGRPFSSARAMLTKGHMSCIAGHQPGLQIAIDKRLDGKSLTAVIAGSCYEHNLGYRNHQTNIHFRGILHLYDVHNGSFLMKPITLDHLKRNYSK